MFSYRSFQSSRINNQTTSLLLLLLLLFSVHFSDIFAQHRYISKLSPSTPPLPSSLPLPSTLVHTHAQTSSELIPLVGRRVSLPRLFKCPRYLSATPSGPGCPGSSPSFRPPTSQLVQAHSLEVVLSLQALSQGGI